MCFIAKNRKFLTIWNPYQHFSYICFMRILKQLFNFYINSSIHVALAVYSLTWITLKELDFNYNESVLYFVFYAAITGYNFVKYFGIAKFRHTKLADWLRLIQILSFVCFILMCYYAFQLQTITLVLVGSFALLTFLYSVPLLSKQNHTLRSIGGLKIYVIALVWTGVTVFIPIIDNSYGINMDVMLMALQRFLFVLVLMFPFEIRDLKYDNIQLVTIPQKIGVKRTKILGGLMVLTILILEFLKDEFSLKRVIVLAVAMLCVLGFLLYSKTNQGKYYSAFWVEGLPILWLVLLLVFA